MKLLLMATVPCKRFDFAPRCEDGRGGWTFSQFGADRYVARPSKLSIKLGLAVWVTPAVPGVYVESSKLIATSGIQEIGTSVTEWKRPNDGGAHHGDGSVFEWIQDVGCPIDDDQLITISVQLKISSNDDWLLVDGCGYVHVTCRDTNDELVTPEEYTESLGDDETSWSW